MYIRVPDDVLSIDYLTGEPVMVQNPKTGAIEQEVITFHWWLQRIVFADPRWTPTLPDQLKGQAIHKAFAGTGPGDQVFIERADWEMLKDVATNPQYQSVGDRGQPVIMRGYANPNVGRRVLPFILAVDGATEKTSPPVGG